MVLRATGPPAGPGPRAIIPTVPSESLQKLPVVLLRGSRFRHDLGRASNLPAVCSLTCWWSCSRTRRKPAAPAARPPVPEAGPASASSPTRAERRAARSTRRRWAARLVPHSFLSLFPFPDVSGLASVPLVPENPVLMGPTWAQLHPFPITAFSVSVPEFSANADGGFERNHPSLRALHQAQRL